MFHADRVCVFRCVPNRRAAVVIHNMKKGMPRSRSSSSSPPRCGWGEGICCLRTFQLDPGTDSVTVNAKTSTGGSVDIADAIRITKQ
jgi:hypothetical protein